MLAHDLRFSSQIRGSPEIIFDLVADMPNYERWLPNSSSFGGTVNVKPYPVRLGTTYLDAGPIEKPGVVTEFDRPMHIGFRHVVQVRRPIVTDVPAAIRYTFQPNAGGTLVIRDLRLNVHLPGLQMLATPALIWAFRRENERTLAHLKHYVEEL